MVSAISPPVGIFADRFGGVLDQVEKHLNELIAVRQHRRQRRIVILDEFDVAGEARLRQPLHVIEHDVNVDRLALDRALVAEHLHAVDELHDAVGFVADQPRQRAVVVVDRLLEQLRRAADARQRILDLVGQHGGERDHRARRAAMGELAVHLVGDGALLQHHHDVVGLLRQRRDVQIDQPVAGIARRAEVDLVFVDGGAARAHLLDQRRAAGCRTAPGRAAGGAATAAPKPRKRIPRRHWRRRPCRRTTTTMTGCGRALSTASAGRSRRQRLDGAHAAFLHAASIRRSGEGLGEAALHHRADRCRSARGCAAALSRCGRRAGRRGGGIERPAEMLARMAQPDIDAVMREHFVVERADRARVDRSAAAALRAFAGRQVTGELAGKPGPALRAAPDHHRVGAGRRKRSVGIVEASDVAVDDDRYRDAVLDGAHRRPVGAPVIELAAGAAMHRDELDAGLLRRVAPVPARCA